MNPTSTQLMLLAEQFFARPSPSDKERERLLKTYLRLKRLPTTRSKSPQYAMHLYADEWVRLQAFGRAMDKLVRFLVQLNSVIDEHQKSFPDDRDTIRSLVELYRHKVTEADAEAHGETM